MSGRNVPDYLLRDKRTGLFVKGEGNAGDSSRSSVNGGEAEALVGSSANVGEAEALVQPSVHGGDAGAAWQGSGEDGRFVIVFLPYKASMWDSFEPVWRRAAADPGIETHVIPIPYFDKNPDGSLGEMRYEGDQFPEEVEITRFDEYDIEAHHPDRIYIHNPYDAGNHVTTIHPYFYSKELKNWTDDLVYIPYFVLSEIDPGNRAAVDGIEGFVMTSGVINAHHVIVQSEAMKAAYVDILTRNSREDLRPYWEAKILGLGSPKLEKADELKDETFELPGEWERVIKKPDGTRKKVILYNTGVTALLQNSGDMLDKIERVLQVFKESAEEVALLWRPHPLYEATLSSMRPELCDRYREIVSRYRQEAWGIFDDTADLARAMAVSDAYYGDPSSVVQLYKELGKPIMIQNVYV